MRIAGIIRNSVVNGVGIRDVIFFQGCTHHCKGCHNPDTWNLLGGREMTTTQLLTETRRSPNDFTISGGEPLLQYLDLVHYMSLMDKYHHKRFWLYTGFTYEEIPNTWLLELSKYVDVLVDGRFEEDKKDLKLRFRGSSNQRLIDLPKSGEKGEVVLWEN